MSILGSLIGGAISAAINRYKSSSSSGSSGSSGGSGGGYSQSAPVSLRDYMSGYGKTPGWDPDTGVVTIGEYGFKPGNVPGTTYNPETGYHYVSDPETINRMLGINSQPQQPQQYPQQPMQQEFDPTEYIEQLKTAKRQSLLAALDKARATALAGLETEKANVAPTYYDARNRAAAASDVGAMNFAQYMAARGIKGAAGAMPEIYRQAGLQGQIGALDRAEANALANIERQRSNIESGYASDVAAAEADVESQAMQALIDQWNANRQYELQKATLTGSLGDQRTLAGLAYDWSRSPSNPAVQAQILANKRAALEIAYQEIVNSYLPQTLKMEAEKLKQQVDAGQYDADIALAQLNQIRAQGRSGGGGSGGGTTVSDTEMKRNNLSQAQNKIWSDLNSGKSIQQVEAEIIRDASKYTQLGLDVDDLVDYAWYAATGASKKTQSGDSAAALRAALGL
jgi:hypothetical protein